MLLYAVHKNASKGFTLVEMIAAVIIVGVIAAIAAPNMLGMLNQTRVKDGLGQVEGAIREAQKLAIRRGRSCSIVFTTNGDDNSVVQVASGFNGCLLSTRELPDLVSLQLLSSGTLSTIDSSNEVILSFSGKGNPDTEGIMVISHPETSTEKCIQIEGLLGNILTGDYDTTTQDCTAQ